ncbi:aspartyl protease family protein [Sphingobium sp.]|uniref:aspartyl protease family protein n=1 Tax=Sphingobium sp. TaxID=1912891 RepID=UPI002628A510|nr:aspartyl protease family protein [Sphingobium sp.]
MKFGLVLAALLATGVWTGPANSQNSSSQDKQEQWQSEANDRYRPAHAPGKPASIPFKLRDNLVAIDVTLNGRRQSAVLDSGSGALVVDQRTTTALGLAVKEPIGDAAGAGAQAQQLRPVEIAALNIGPLGFKELPGLSANLEQLSSSAGFPIDLIIGAPAFKYGAVRVDYRKQLISFGPSGSLGKCAAPIPLTIVSDIPMVEAEIRTMPNADPVKLKLVVDLGTRHQALMIGGPFVRSEAGKALIASGKVQQVGHGTGGQVQGSVAAVAELRLGGTVFPGVEAALSSGVKAFEIGLFDGSLGVPLWKAGTITFDYPAKTLCIER